ncbi:MAG: hypothetical protein KGI58_00225 [Patescibacteria group bacterium]|nr:hypothetical protein [Patescibacteria group bacterium]
MPKKTKIIFIIVFILVGSIMLGFYFYVSKKNTSGTNSGSNNAYQPFLGGNTTPQGGNGNSTSSNNTSGTQTNTPIDSQVAPQASKFHQITNISVAGAAYLEDTRKVQTTGVALPGGLTQPTSTTKTTTKVAAPRVETVPSVRYVERATGYIDEMYLDTKVSGEISNSTIPSIYRAFFGNDANSVIYQYLSPDTGDTINSFMATLGGSKGEFLPSNVINISLSPDKSKFFYLVKTSSGVNGIVRSFGDTKASQVFSSRYSEWLSQWVTKDKVFLTTKASSAVDGSVFSLNIISGISTKIFGSVKGLTTLANNDGSLILYSTSDSSVPQLKIFNTKNRTTFDLNTPGLAEKCIWSADNINIYCAIPSNIIGGDYPDSWYQGLVSFNDRFAKINSITGDQIDIADSTNEIAVDATKLFLNKDESQLFFINKKDSTLWSLDLN